MRTWLVAIRDERTQSEMAKQLGVSQQMYGAMEAGKRNPGVKRAKEMAQVLGIEWTRFFEASTDQESGGHTMDSKASERTMRPALSLAAERSTSCV